MKSKQDVFLPKNYFEEKVVKKAVAGKKGVVVGTRQKVPFARD